MRWSLLLCVSAQLVVACSAAELQPAFAAAPLLPRLRGGGLPQFWVNQQDLQNAPQRWKGGLAKFRAMCGGATEEGTAKGKASRLTGSAGRAWALGAQACTHAPAAARSQLQPLRLQSDMGWWERRRRCREMDQGRHSWAGKGHAYGACIARARARARGTSGHGVFHTRPWSLPHKVVRPCVHALSRSPH